MQSLTAAPNGPDRPRDDEPDLREQSLKERIAAELAVSRVRTLRYTDIDDAELIRQHSTIMSPLVWDLAHVGNYEELWLLRGVAGVEPLRPHIDTLYDAFATPRRDRPSLPLLSPAESRRYVAGVRSHALEVLSSVRFDDGRNLTTGGFVFGMVVQHEHQHAETMLATHQLRAGEPVLPDAFGRQVPPAASPAPAPLPARSAEVLVPAGESVQGTSTDPWAYDNERPAHRVTLPAYFIDVYPVTNAAHLAFLADGGYDDERLWSAAGWQWRCAEQIEAPLFWRRDGQTWVRRRFGRDEPVPEHEPVQHVSWYEAEAHARWAGKRLPTEAEWEKACGWDPSAGRLRRFPWGDTPPGPAHANLAHADPTPGAPESGALRPSPIGSLPRGASPSGVQHMIGDVWEWTSSTFTPYPGFRSFPYREYSEVFFGAGAGTGAGGYRVLRGGSWATHPSAARTTFRNWDHPVRRQIFCGFRLARDAGSPGAGPGS